MMIGRVAAAAALIVLLAQGVAGAVTSAPVPAAIQPAGARLLFTAQASGVQIYRSVADPGGPLHWQLQAPLAQLTGDDGRILIRHYAGPSWEAADGSKAMLDPAGKVVAVPAPPETDATAMPDIPWLLVPVTASPEPDGAAPGVLGQVAFVQRSATHGGAAPATPPLRPDTQIGVAYTATYAFFARAE
jgi:hypothetical protein